MVLRRSPVMFAWVFGMDKGWREITSGADIKVPGVYKYIIKFITPLLLLWVFVGSLITPKDGDWAGAFSNGWELDNSSIIKKIMNSELKEQIACSLDSSKGFESQALDRDRLKTMRSRCRMEMRRGQLSTVGSFRPCVMQIS